MNPSRPTREANRAIQALLAHAHQPAEVLAFRDIQQKAAPDNSADAVAKRRKIDVFGEKAVVTENFPKDGGGNRAAEMNVEIGSEAGIAVGSEIRSHLHFPPTPPRMGKECSGKQKHEEREKLSFCQHSHHFRIRFAELFTDDPEDRIQGEK